MCRQKKESEQIFYYISVFDKSKSKVKDTIICQTKIMKELISDCLVKNNFDCLFLPIIKINEKSATRK